MAGEGGGGVESDDHGAGLQFVDNAGGDFADRRIRNSKNDDIGAVEPGLCRHAIDAKVVLQARLAGITDLDVAHIEARAFQVFGEPVAHFAAGAEKSNCSHISTSFTFGLWYLKWYDESMSMPMSRGRI